MADVEAQIRKNRKEIRQKEGSKKNKENETGEGQRDYSGELEQ